MLRKKAWIAVSAAGHGASHIVIHVIAVVEFSQLIELVELRLCIKLCVFAAVRQEGVQVVEEMSMSVGDASRAEDQDSLLVLLGDAVAGGGFGCGRF